MKPRLMRFFVCAAAAAAMGLVLPGDLTVAAVEQAERLFGLSFTEAKRDSMLAALADQRRNYIALRSVALENSDMPAMNFDPIPKGFRINRGTHATRWSAVRAPAVPANLEDLAFCSVGELAALVKARKVTSMQLTQMYLNRLKRYGPSLECVVTLTESLAVAQARKADREISAGRYRGPLHGIPYGAKDLLAVKGYPTSWGVALYKEREFPENATVIRKLEEAGAVLVAKLTLGELAMGDVWYGGMTRNPWNPAQGSSGSSAGSASATSAGLVGFSIGSETWGSIVSPSTRCGTTGLRPTYGRVSRHGAMALSWSMDKIGPICRTVEDCALVFDAIQGADPDDPTVIEASFIYKPFPSLRGLRIGVVQADFDSLKEQRDLNLRTLEVLQRLGAVLVPITMPAYPVNDCAIILSAEAGAAFDDLTRTGRDDMLKQQSKDSWPNIFRSSRFIPAVEYIQACRVRRKLCDDMESTMKTVDLYVVPSFSDNLLLTNLTGHPCVVLPNGFDDKGNPVSITFIGRLFGEGILLAASKAYQDAVGFHLKHPALPQR